MSIAESIVVVSFSICFVCLMIKLGRVELKIHEVKAELEWLNGCVSDLWMKNHFQDISNSGEAGKVSEFGGGKTRKANLPTRLCGSVTKLSETDFEQPDASGIEK